MVGGAMIGPQNTVVKRLSRSFADDDGNFTERRCVLERRKQVVPGGGNPQR
jgi:hypothetical protein